MTKEMWLNKESLFKYKDNIAVFERYMSVSGDLIDPGGELFPEKLESTSYCDFVMEVFNHVTNYDQFYEESYAQELLYKANYYSITKAINLLVESDLFNVSVKDIPNGFPQPIDNKELAAYLMEFVCE